MTEKDHYATLGVPEDASQAQIKSRYRVLARQYHPDAAPADSTAAARFSELADAYDVLGNPEKRARYDQSRLSHDDHEIVIEDDSSETPSAFDTEGRSGYRPGAPPPPAAPPPAPPPPPPPAPSQWSPPPVVPPSRPTYQQPYRQNPYLGHPATWPGPIRRPRRRRRVWLPLLLSLVVAVCGLFVAWAVTVPAAEACPPPAPASAKALPKPPGNDAIAWQGQVTLSSQCYVSVDGSHGPVDRDLPSADNPDGLLMVMQGSNYSIYFYEDPDFTFAQPQAVKAIGVKVLKTVPSRSACQAMAHHAPVDSFPAAGPSVCVISNGNHVIYLKITSVHNARFHQTQWVTADMIEWKQKAG